MGWCSTCSFGRFDVCKLVPVSLDLAPVDRSLIVGDVNSPREINTPRHYFRVPIGCRYTRNDEGQRQDGQSKDLEERSHTQTALELEEYSTTALNLCKILVPQVLCIVWSSHSEQHGANDGSGANEC